VRERSWITSTDLLRRIRKLQPGKLLCAWQPQLWAISVCSSPSRAFAGRRHSWGTDSIGCGHHHLRSADAVREQTSVAAVLSVRAQNFRQNSYQCHEEGSPVRQLVGSLVPRTSTNADERRRGSSGCGRVHNPGVGCASARIIPVRYMRRCGRFWCRCNRHLHPAIKEASKTSGTTLLTRHSLS